MSKWFGPVALALTLFGISAVEPAAAGTSQATARQQATSQQATSQQATSETTEISSRRQHRLLLHHEATRPYYHPTYYDRPQYYRPYPYNVPAPFVFGFGFGPWW
jgi:hypothetical protein